MGEKSDDELLKSAIAGDPHSRETLLLPYRSRLKALVNLRLNPRLKDHISVNEILQLAIHDICLRLAEYNQKRPLPFYLWLREQTIQRLRQVHREHLAGNSLVENRSLRHGPLPRVSTTLLASMLLGNEMAAPHRAGDRQRIDDALGRLESTESEILVLRHLEKLSIEETALVLGIVPKQVPLIYRMALKHLSVALGREVDGPANHG